MTKSKLERGFYPIYAKDIRRKVGYCETWGYGNKDTCKYVAETIIEDMRRDYDIEVLCEKESELNRELISIVHDFNSGGSLKGDKMLIPIK